MEKAFYKISEHIYQLLNKEEKLTLSFGGEKSQFIRFNGAKVRQTGFVNDAGLGIELICNHRKNNGGITLSGEYEADLAASISELNRLRSEISQLPEDPYIVMPGNAGSSREDYSGKLLSESEAVVKLVAPFQGVDMAGIWASGRIFRGNTNSEGQKHWFATDTFSLDYSLITPSEKMVKATFAGTNWNQSEYEEFVANSIKKLDIMKLPPKKIKPGEYRTYIASAGVADILSMFSWGGVSEAAIQQGESAFCKMRNENLSLSPLFSLDEDFRMGTVPRFNGHGEVAPEILPLITEGRLVNTLISSRTAREYKKKSNYASANEGLRSPVMKGGELKEEDILMKLGTGVYLSNLHYLNWSDQIGGRITGMTRYACFWVENGKIIAPIENMRFDDSFYQFFGPNLEAVTAQVMMNPEVATYEGRALGGIHCPGILLSKFSLTL